MNNLNTCMEKEEFVGTFCGTKMAAGLAAIRL
jgi:hypothetical protein